jgi:hypothetical protein
MLHANAPGTNRAVVVWPLIYWKPQLMTKLVHIYKQVSRVYQGPGWRPFP